MIFFYDGEWLMNSHSKSGVLSDYRLSNYCHCYWL